MSEKATYWARKTADRNARAANSAAKQRLNPKLELYHAAQRPVCRRTQPGEGQVVIGTFSSIRKRMRAYRRFGTLSMER